MGLEAIFDDQVPLAARFIFAFVAVIALIAVIVFLLRRFGPGHLKGQNVRRGNRLGVLDVAPVDGQRRLVIVRRDAVEHLIMIGGPNDLLIESHIVRAEPATQRPAVASQQATSPAEAPRKPAPPDPDTAAARLQRRDAPPAPATAPVPPPPPTPPVPPTLPRVVHPQPAAPQPAPARAVAGGSTARPASAAPAPDRSPARPTVPAPPTGAQQPRVSIDKLDDELTSILGKLKAPPKT